MTLGYGWCFTIDAISYLAVLLCLFLMRPAELFRQPVRPRMKGAVREGLRYVRSAPILWLPFVMLATISLLAYNFSVTLPLFVTEGLNSSEIVFTELYSMYSFGAVVGALVVAQRSRINLRQIITGAVLLGIFLLLLSIVPNVPLAFPIMFLIGVASILYMTATIAIVQTESKPEMHGRLLALQTVIIGGSAAIGGPICGWLAGEIGARGLMTLGGMVCLATAAFGYLINRHYAKPSVV